MKIQQLRLSVQTLDWFGDKIVDWSRSGKSYSLTGETKQLAKYHFGYKFDSAIRSANAEYVFLYEKLGTKGLLLKNGEIIREINRSYYHAEVYEYPAVFLDFNGKTYLVHCRVSYCQLDFEDVETGELVTNTPTRKPSDIFHSRLEVSAAGKYLMSKGWVWHPADVIYVFRVENCFSNPNLLDEANHNFPDVGSEICTASFIDDNNILLGSSKEIFNDENMQHLPAESLAVWNMSDNSFSKKMTPGFEFGNVFSISETLCWDLYMFPKVINLSTGEIVDKAESVFSGTQRSSIIFDSNNQPQIAFDNERQSLAVVKESEVIIVTRE